MSPLYQKPTSKAVAAHAVAHLQLGLPGTLKYIALDGLPPHWSGRTEIDRPSTCIPSREQVGACITQCLVGAQAEAKIDCEWPSAKCGAENDYSKTKQYAKYFGLAEDIPQWEDTAKQFVNDHWSKIDAIAEALLAQPGNDSRRVLLAAELLALFNGLRV